MSKFVVITAFAWIWIFPTYNSTNVATHARLHIYGRGCSVCNVTYIWKVSDCSLPAHENFYFLAPNSKCALAIALSEKNKYHTTIQYDDSKWVTHARVFSQTLAHGNNKNEKDKETDEEGKFSLVFRFTSASVFLPYRAGFSLCTCSCTVGKREVSFSMTIGNELIHECFPKHLRMGTARMK